MFTGIVEEKGTVREASGGRSGLLRVNASLVLEGAKVGDSIMVSGACLTVVDLKQDNVAFEVTPETLNSTVIGGLRAGSAVNLERAMRIGDRLGGHLVNGHVDAVGTVTALRREENSVVLRIEMPPEVSRYVVTKGSVAVDGISLTVVEARERWFSVSVIPLTLEVTSLAEASPGTKVNLEVDVVAKYVESLLSRGSGAAGIEDALFRGGFMPPDQM